MITSHLDLDLPASALELARVFTAGGRLVVTAQGREDHARHVAVEFIHPAITGARSLPALSVSLSDLSAAVEPNDAVLVIQPTDGSGDIPVPPAQLVLRVGSERSGPELVRWYHLLWELVQLGLEHPGLTGGTASKGGDPTNFLYPFLDAVETDEPRLLGEMAVSAHAKHLESQEVGLAAVSANTQTLDLIASAIRQSDLAGGRVFTMGNGGSSSDAARLSRKLRVLGVRSLCIAEDPAILTALANDLGVTQIFARQVEAAMQPADVLVAFSTSGSSANLLSAFDVGVAAKATVVSCSGYGGGPLSTHPNVNHALVLDSASVHRIQEAQAVLMDVLCERVSTPTASAAGAVR